MNGIQVGKGDGDEEAIQRWLDERSRIRGRRVIRLEALREQRLRIHEQAQREREQRARDVEDLNNRTIFIGTERPNLTDKGNGFWDLTLFGVDVPWDACLKRQDIPQRRFLIVRCPGLFDTPKRSCREPGQRPYYLVWEGVCLLDWDVENPDHPIHQNLSFHARRMLKVSQELVRDEPLYRGRCSNGADLLDWCRDIDLIVREMASA